MRERPIVQPRQISEWGGSALPGLCPDLGVKISPERVVVSPEQRELGPE